MKITFEQLSSLHWGEMEPDLWGDNEDVAFHIYTNNLYFHNCINGELTLYRRVKDFEDLRQALYDEFKIETE